LDDPEAYRQMTTRAYEWITRYDAVWAYQNYRTFLLSVIHHRA